LSEAYPFFYEEPDMTQTILHIEGMTCDHCAHSVQKALLSVAGVQKADVNLAQKKATLLYEGPLDLSAAQKAVEEEGYKAFPEN
jgi:copper chaperone CopZ